ncbi:AEC family transporter [Leptothrix discophora]|uniref:AEC family transporter n=1 Tax=Leptothrix discophora TaxID=89 RepID=A0ABT9G779_LEPDI|nr:AEC family transporter [Leptothrix discophora]MDP4302339.1 AEC family transporter [Leptothrix discophora]
MQAILSVTVPVFALVLTGYLAARRRLLPLDAVPGLNAFVLTFALPCLLFRFGASLPWRDLLDPVVLAIYAGCALLLVAFTIAVTLKPPVGLKDAAFGALVGAFPNSGYMGVPLLVALLGPAAAGPTITTVLVDLLLTCPLCLAIAQSRHELPTQPPQPFEVDGHDEVTSSLPPAMAAEASAQARLAVLTAPATLSSPAPRPLPHVAQPSPAAETRATLLRALRGSLSSPMPWAIALGAGVSMTGLALPEPLDRVIAMLAEAASPVALFTLGAVLWRASMPRRAAGPLVLDDQARSPHRIPLARVLPVVMIKLLLHPLLVLVGGLIARALGLPLSGFQLTVLVLVAALPSASGVMPLAERYGADNGRVTRIILWSTLLAFVSFPVLAWLFQLQPT